MPIGFAIFITAVIVSVLSITIYHLLIAGNNGGGGSGGGYNYDVNIQYLNTLTNSLAQPMITSLDADQNFDSGNNYPDLPDGAARFRSDLSKP